VVRERGPEAFDGVVVEHGRAQAHAAERAGVGSYPVESLSLAFLLEFVCPGIAPTAPSAPS
jgi:hypothetical protein